MDITFNKNEDHNKLLVSDLNHHLKRVYLGGGEKRIEKHHAKGKMTARERIDFLLDTPEAAIEIGAFAGDGMYKEHGGCPSGGVVVKIGKVSGKSIHHCHFHLIPRREGDVENPQGGVRSVIPNKQHYKRKK